MLLGGGLWRWNRFIFVRAGLVNFAQAHVVGGVGRRMSGQNGVFFARRLGAHTLPNWFCKIWDMSVHMLE